MSDAIRRNMALFPIGIVMKLTELTARQIRYYEQQDLIQPARTEGRQRLFSFNDVDRLLEIKKLMEKGVNIAGVKEVLSQKYMNQEQNVVIAQNQVPKQRPEMTDEQLHKLLKRQLMEQAAQPNRVSLIQGELSRFFH